MRIFKRSTLSVGNCTPYWVVWTLLPESDGNGPGMITRCGVILRTPAEVIRGLTEAKILYSGFLDAQTNIYSTEHKAIVRVPVCVEKIP